ncbi:MAG: hypothetical protein K2H14_01370 [Muribaculaceae bacterium]|nr:hypothetical protein [Muribaculaceae bacterium]
MVSARSVTSFFHAQSSTVALLLVACVCTFFAWHYDVVMPDSRNMGVGLESANLWFPFGLPSATLNITANAAIALFIIYINRAFNVLRSLTALVATMFLAMQIAMPRVLCRFNDGSMLALVMLMCAALLFSVFGNRHGQKRIFLAFCLLGWMAFTRIAYLFYVPVLLGGCVQMRVFSPRDILAALIGVITPAWIMFGFGLVDWREISFAGLTGGWQWYGGQDSVRLMVVSGFTILTGTFFTVANLLKILSYNSRVRAFNGFFTLLFIATALLTVVNYSNFTFYIPLLDCMAAYQVGHFFTYRRSPRSFIPVLLLVLTYFGFYLWALLR